MPGSDLDIAQVHSGIQLVVTNVCLSM